MIIMKLFCSSNDLSALHYEDMFSIFENEIKE